MKSRVDPSPQISTVGWCVIASVVLCVFEGAARKWLLPNSTPAVQALMYFSKDVPLAIAGFLTLLNPKRPASAIFGPMAQLLIVGTVLVLMGSLIAIEGFNPMGAVITLRNGVILPWVAWLLGRNLTGRSDIIAICHVIGCCAIVNAILGGIQFYLPGDHVLNLQPTDLTVAVEDAGRLRASGTFSYITGMADLCIITAWAGAVLVGGFPRRPLGYIYVFAGLTCTAVAMSRSGLVYSLSLISLVLIFNSKLRYVGIAIALIGLFGYGFGGSFFDEAATNDPGIHNAIWSRHKAAGDGVEDRAFGTIISDLPAVAAEYPFGVGLGATQMSGQVSAKENSLTVFVSTEGEHARVVYEVGILGFCGIYLIRIGSLVILITLIQSIAFDDRQARYAAWWPTMFLIFFGLNMSVVFDHMQATYQAVALMCILSVFETQARLKRRP
jgi:hypothetical protein